MPPHNENPVDLTTEIVEDKAELIEKAFLKAAELNREYPDLGVTWRDIVNLPIDDFMQIAINPAQTEQANAAA